jgi:hypothetical protein
MVLCSRDRFGQHNIASGGIAMRKFVVTLLMIILIGFAILIVDRNNGLGNRDCMPGDTASDLVRCIRNEDIRWDGTGLGLLPRPSGPTEELLNTKENIEPLLVDALVDQDRFVAAHVLLTIRSQGEFSSERGAWNNLRVKLSADGQVSYEGNDLAELQKWWEERLQ